MALPSGAARLSNGEIALDRQPLDHSGPIASISASNAGASVML
jgi:hypothetical protein